MAVNIGTMGLSFEAKNGLLIKLEQAYYSGILKVREGDTWLEYQDGSQMRLAIEDLKNSLCHRKPRGTRLLKFSSKGY